MDIVVNVLGIIIGMIAAMFLVDITVEILRGPPFGE